MHEFGHLIAFWLIKLEIKEINFGFASVDICKARGMSFCGLKKELIVTLSGSAMNFLAFLIFWILYYSTQERKCLYFAVQSFAIGAVNFLPIDSLDGGIALNLILEKKFGFEKSQKISKIVSWMFLLPIIIFGVYILLRSKYNFSVLILALYLVFEILK